MKKISIAIMACFILLYSCTKENKINDVLNKKESESKVDTLNASLNKRGKKIAAYDQVPLDGAPRFPASYYTVIAYFQHSINDATVVPKGIWYSPNGQYYFSNQGDGNLVLYKSINGTPIWASNTYPKTTTLLLQGNLNMIVKENGNPIWDSGTWIYRHGTTNPQNAALVITNDGDLGIIADGANGFGVARTLPLGSTRTTGGVQSPNWGVFFRNAGSASQSQYHFIY